MDLLTEKIRKVSYPGRGIVQGISSDEEYLIQLYWIMGRSENSRNRVFQADQGVLETAAADPKLLQDPSLVIYEAMLETKPYYIVSNGDQTRTIHEQIKSGGTFAEALMTRDREPDAPNYTPRISAMIEMSQGKIHHSFSIIKANPDCPEESLRHFFYRDHIEPGQGLTLTTYQNDGSPLPSFNGEPYTLPLQGSPEDIMNTFWGALHEENKISLALKAISQNSGQSTITLRNKYQQVTRM